MKKISVFIGILIFLAISATPTYARSGCCSHHGGVSGCGCADGTPLSNTCAPYYPECYNGGQQQTQTAPQTYVAPPTAIQTYRPFPTVNPKPTIKPLVKKKAGKHTVKRKPTLTPTRMPTPTPTPQKNFFQTLFGW